MNINDFVKANAAALYLGTRSSQQTGTVGLSAQPVFQKAEKRIQAQVDVTTAQLSSFGKLKSSLSDVQLASRALGGLASTTTAAAQKSAANTFLLAFNSAIDSAKASAGIAGDRAATQSAVRTIQGLLHALNATPATTDALKNLGFDLGSNGKLVLDSSKFDAAQKADPTAVLASLGVLGQQLAAVSTKELGTDGNLGLSLSSLSQRSSILKSQQGLLASLGQSTSAGQGSATSGAYDFGLAAYRKNLVSSS